MKLTVYTGSGNWETVETDSKYFYVGRVGSGTSCWVEPAEFVKMTKKNLIFKTSRLEIRTQVDSFNTVGKALANRLFLIVRDTPIDFETDKHYYKTVHI